MIDLTEEAIEPYLDEESYRKVCRAFAGCRISIRSTRVAAAEIRRDYRQMVRAGVQHKDAISRLAALHEKSRSQIKRIIRCGVKHERKRDNDERRA